jgi:hypothetical protein
MFCGFFVLAKNPLGDHKIPMAWEKLIWEKYRLPSLSSQVFTFQATLQKYANYIEVNFVKFNPD